MFGPYFRMERRSCRTALFSPTPLWPAAAIWPSFLLVLMMMALLLAPGVGALGGGLIGACPLTQFRCSTGRCVNLNMFCDGRNDCGDNSDEPAHCTRNKRVPFSSFCA